MTSVNNILLREVIASDLPIFFEHQSDPEAARMADFPARELEAFHAHWQKIMAEDSIILRTILFEDLVAGNIVSFLMNQEREVGYWLGRDFWGKGIATQALQLFLPLIPDRPLYGFTTKHNLASQKVLTHCGFKLLGESEDMLKFTF